MSEFKQLRNPTVWNPKDHTLYVDDPSLAEPRYDIPLMDTEMYAASIGTLSKAASTVPLEQIFFNNSKSEHNMLDQAYSFYAGIEDAQNVEKHPSKIDRLSLAAAVITSLDFPDFQNNLIIGSNVETAVRTGILTGLFQEVAVPNLTGKWASYTNDLKYHRNIPETKSPEPSGGAGAIVTVSVQKHGGAVAITERAEMVINGDSPFQRLVGQMQLRKQFDENDMVADEIESNVANVIPGVDFGARTGSPPTSTTNPTEMISAITNAFEAQAMPWDLFISKGMPYIEFTTNDIVRGINNPLPAVGNINEQVGPFPLAGGVTWARDNAMTDATAGFALNRNAIKIFRGPSRNYTIANPDTETTKYVTKNYMLPDTVDASVIYKVTGIFTP